MIRTLKGYVDIFNVIRAMALKEVCFLHFAISDFEIIMTPKNRITIFNVIRAMVLKEICFSFIVKQLIRTMKNNVSINISCN